MGNTWLEDGAGQVNQVILELLVSGENKTASNEAALLFRVLALFCLNKMVIEL